MSISATPDLDGASLSRRRSLLRPWLLLTLALLGALLTLIFGVLRGAQLASSSPIPNTAIAAQSETMMRG
jgi:hypothetical protein